MWMLTGHGSCEVLILAKGSQHTAEESFLQCLPGVCKGSKRPERIFAVFARYNTRMTKEIARKPIVGFIALFLGGGVKRNHHPTLSLAAVHPGFCLS